MRYLLKISYDGTDFHGWQRQPNALGVQQQIEEALGVLLRHEVAITGSGRTDTGVHARRTYAHFDTDRLFPDDDATRRFLRGLAKLCGPAINVSGIARVADDFNARFDATRRTYKYFVTYHRSPFLRHHAWYAPHSLDMDAMNEAAKLLLGRRDFTSFAKLHSDAHTNICTVEQAHWENHITDFSSRGMVFTIAADRFLRNMVRSVVGTLVDVGRGKIGVEEMQRIILALNRCEAGTSMPAHALYLWDVEYPSEKFYLPAPDAVSPFITLL